METLIFVVAVAQAIFCAQVVHVFEGGVAALGGF